MLKLNPNPNQDTLISTTIKILPLISIFSVAIGYQFISSYYDQFGIDILLYMDSLEIVSTCFLSMFKFLGINIVLLYSLLKVFEFLFKLKYRNQKRAEVIIVTIACVIFGLIYFFVKILSGDAGRELSYLLLFLFVVYYFLFISSKVNNRIKELKFIILSLILMLFLQFTHLGNAFYRLEYLSLPDRNGKTYGEKTACFYHHERLIKSSNTLIFIGQTRNYLFLWDKQKDETSIYPMSDISNLKIKTKHYPIDWGKIF